MKGHSPDVIHGNIKELVKSGRDPKQAIAIALANARNSKKMAMGGMVEEDEDMPSDLYEINSRAVDAPEDISNPEEQAEDGQVAFSLKMGNPGGMEEGLEQTPSNELMGAKPSEDMKDGLEEPMPMLSSEVMEALKNKKKNRRYMNGA